jgi:Nif-specific regulatory protein
MEGQTETISHRPPAAAQIQAPLTLSEIEQSLGAIHDLDRLVQFATEQIVVLLEAESAAVILLDHKRHELYFQSVDHSQPNIGRKLREIRFPADRGIAGWVIREGVPTIVSDATLDSRFYPGVDVQTGAKTKSYLCAPLKSKNQTFGVLTAVNKHHGSFSQGEMLLAEMFARQLANAIENAYARQGLTATRERLREERCQQREDPGRIVRFDTCVGASPQMQEVYRLVDRILNVTTTVLITGESGTGKELIARALHSRGARAKGLFIAVNCAAIPETLLEAELFGYERGAFTGAVQRKLGRFELAGGGTLFLDEIGEMSPALQAKLLRVLQEKQFERVGGTATIATNARIIAATNRDLPSLIAQGKFREDLFYRLNIYPIPLPPLRKRREDILPLARHFLRKYGRELNKEGLGLAQEARALFLNYSWPGNIRELENVMERAVILCQDKLVSDRELPLSLRERSKGPKMSGEAFPPLIEGMTLAELEKSCILQALEQTNYNRLQASKLLRISRTQLRTRMKNHGLEGKQRWFSIPDDARNERLSNGNQSRYSLLQQ